LLLSFLSLLLLTMKQYSNLSVKIAQKTFYAQKVFWNLKDRIVVGFVFYVD